MASGSNRGKPKEAPRPKGSGPKRQEGVIVPFGDGGGKGGHCGVRNAEKTKEEKGHRRRARLRTLIENADLGHADRKRLLAIAENADMVKEGDQEEFDRGFAQLVGFREALHRAMQPVRRESLRSENVYRLDGEASDETGHGGDR